MTLARRPTAEGEEFEAHTGDVIYASAAGILHQERWGQRESRRHRLSCGQPTRVWQSPAQLVVRV